MSKKMFLREMYILSATKVACYVVAALAALAAALPFVVALFGLEAEGILPLVGVLALAVVALFICFAAATAVKKINSVIKYRKREYAAHRSRK